MCIILPLLISRPQTPSVFGVGYRPLCRMLVRPSCFIWDQPSLTRFQRELVRADVQFIIHLEVARFAHCIPLSFDTYASCSPLCDVFLVPLPTASNGGVLVLCYMNMTLRHGADTRQGGHMIADMMRFAGCKNKLRLSFTSCHKNDFARPFSVLHAIPLLQLLYLGTHFVFRSLAASGQHRCPSS